MNCASRTTYRPTQIRTVGIVRSKRCTTSLAAIGTICCGTQQSMQDERGAVRNIKHNSGRTPYARCSDEKQARVPKHNLVFGWTRIFLGTKDGRAVISFQSEIVSYTHRPLTKARDLQWLKTNLFEGKHPQMPHTSVIVRRQQAGRLIVQTRVRCIYWFTLGSFFSGVRFMRELSDGEARKDVASRGAT